MEMEEMVMFEKRYDGINDVLITIDVMNLSMRGGIDLVPLSSSDTYRLKVWLYVTSS